MEIKRNFIRNCANCAKFCIFFLCHFLFLYTMIKIIDFYNSHHTVLDVRLKKPEKFIFPAFTFCNENLIKRSKYCSTYPSHCEKPENMTIFCNRYPQYCETYENPFKASIEWEYDKNFLIPKRDYYVHRDVAPMDELANFTQNASSILIYTTHSEDTEGPKFYQKPKRSTLIPCFTQFSRVDSDEEPHKSAFAPFEMFARNVGDYPTMIHRLTLNIEPAEYFDPTKTLGAYFTLHSPFESLNPHYKGVFLKPGRTYHVHLQLEEDHLSAYESDCTDYVHTWEKQNKKGARSQQMCLERCELEYSLACRECVERPIMYPTKSPKCSFGNRSSFCTTESSERYRSCKSSCKKDCSKLKFLYSVQEVPDLDTFFPDAKWKYIEIHVYMDEPHILDRTYIPKIHSLEVFGMTGGFLCICLCILFLFVKFVDFIHTLVASRMQQHSSVNSTE